MTGATSNPDARGATEVLRLTAEAGIDLAALTTELEREGVQAFCASYHQLLDGIQVQLERATYGTAAESAFLASTDQPFQRASTDSATLVHTRPSMSSTNARCPS